MLDIFNIPTPQGANYQEFYGSYPTGAGVFTTHTWVKPRGASMVRILLIGAGGGGGNGSTSVGGGGGGSGGVTSWIGPAIFIPDNLIIAVGRGGTSGVDGTATIVRVEGNAGTGYYDVLQAYGGGSGTTAVTAGNGASAFVSNYFCASGILNAVGGQSGSAGTSSGTPTAVAASSTTFLSGGAGGAGSSVIGTTVTPNYGYPASVATPAGNNKGNDGFFITQPILVGRGGAGGGTTTTAGGSGGKGGIGCGGGGSGEDAASGGRGGDGAVFIWAW